ncbi:aryl hydrocarbon receptor-like [Scyliorhinus torazame]|uniref:aryl hydrocarbon receptor-like n=1 Tax=Scyliorhinus torazame TaxID=75743 RepID=UPI003B5A6CDE
MSAQTLGLTGSSQVTSPHPGLCNMIASTRNIFMGRKRKRVPQHPESTKQGTGNAAKSNPSKRHRDRLNVEFDNLLGLLPTTEEIAGRLDKLSVLRLGVSCLRLKRFFEVTLGQRKRCLPAERPGNAGVDKRITNLGNVMLSEGELLLQALNGFVLVVTSEGDIFYASPTVQEYVGFHQTAVMHQPVYELIHPDDRSEFQRQLHWALDPLPLSNTGHSGNGRNCDVLTRYDPQQLPPENSTFLERNFVCKMRSLLNSPSGYVALNIEGRLKYLHGQNKRAEDGTLLPPQLALFAIATPLQVPSILEIRTRSALFQTKHKLDFTPVDCDARAKIVLGYSEVELCMRGSGYQFIHADDMLYCADNHVRLMKTGESGLTFFRLLTKQNVWIWVQANARLVYKNGQPDCIIAKQRLLTDKEGIDNFQKRTMPFPLPFSTGEAVLYDHSPRVLGLANPFPPENGTGREQDGYLDPNSVLGAMMSQDKAVYIRCPAVEPKYSLSRFGEAVSSGLGMSPPCPQIGVKNMKEEESSCQQDDDLLSILDDMLQSDNDEGLSSLPNVLESLGPEDLELMQWVESTLCVGADSECSLSDMLTNDRVLSYVQESLEKQELGRHSPCPSTSLQPALGAGDQSAQCPDLSQRRGQRPTWMPPVPGQLNAAPLIPEQPSRANQSTQGGVPPSSLRHQMQQQDLFQQQCVRQQQQDLPEQQRMQWAHSVQQPMQTSSPMQHQYVQQQVLCKQRAARRGPQPQQHLQQPGVSQPGQQAYHHTWQPSDPSLSSVSGLNPATAMGHSLSNGYIRTPQNCRVESQQGVALFHPPPNSPNAPACGAPSQHGRLDFNHSSIALTRHGQGTRNQTGWLPGASQPGATAFPIFSSPPPHVGGKGTSLSVFHATSTVPLSHLNEYSHLHPEEQNGWHHVDLYKIKEDPNGILGFHPSMNGTPIFGNGSAQ